MHKHPGISPAENKKRSEVTRISAGTTALSKEQQTFNKMVRKIEKLKQQIREDKEKLYMVLSIYLRDVLPRLIQISQAKIRICHLLDEKRSRVKLIRCKTPHFWAFGHSPEILNDTLEYYDSLIANLNKHIHDLQVNKRNASTISECISQFFRYRDMSCFQGTGSISR